MTGVDKEKVNKVVYEMSKNSKYYQHAQRQDEKVSHARLPGPPEEGIKRFFFSPIQVDRRVEATQRLLRGLDDVQKAGVEQETAHLLKKMAEGRRRDRCVLWMLAAM
jgi:hypothetical protein